MEINNIEAFSGMDSMDIAYKLLQQKLELGGALSEKEQELYSNIIKIYRYYYCVAMEKMYSPSSLAIRNTEVNQARASFYHGSADELVDDNPEIDFEKRLILSNEELGE